MTYGYARVSTRGQAKEGNSIEAQIAALKEAGAQEIYYDVYTGIKMSRPEFDRMKGELKEGDRLVVTKLDRFARSAAEGNALIEELIGRGVTVHVLNMGMLDDTPTGRLIRNIMFSFAEFERELIIERTQEGKAAAREQGKRVDGRPFKTERETRIAYLKKWREGRLTVSQCCKELGIGKTTWYVYAKREGAWDW